MRFTWGRAVRVILLVTVLIFLNGYVVLFSGQKRVSEVKKSDFASYPVGIRLGGNGPKTVDNNTNYERDLKYLALKRGGGQVAADYELLNETKNLNDIRLGKGGTSQPGLSQKQNYSNGVGNVFNSNVDYSLDFSEARPTELSDIFISVKTTKRYHKQRVRLLLDTWARLAKDETYFFTDVDDKELTNRTKGHIINTNCSAVHNRVALCCKMSVEYDYFIASRKRWFCHVDDDTYINIPELARLLRKFNHTEDWYLGKPSLSHPLEIADPDHRGQRVAFWFATGGAGVCISRSLALKMMPYTAGGRLQSVCSAIRLPDDCSIGFIIYVHLRKELTVIPKFHSHLEGLWMLNADNLDQQITMSYNEPTVRKLKNTVHVDGFSEDDDPTRFRSIHCQLFPYLEGCPRASRS